MARHIQFLVTPELATDSDYLKDRIKTELDLDNDEFSYKWKRRSIDARKRQIVINCSFDVFEKNEVPSRLNVFKPKTEEPQSKVAIIGCGPAGLYAALRALELGIKPIIFERGKDVRARRRDLALLSKESIVNTESNYCYGEGGAGTYSDGKLYTRSKKRGSIIRALEWFVHFGASEDILVDAQPHIGTNKLPQIIVKMREAIIENGGEVHFESKLTNIIEENGTVTGIEINGTQKLVFKRVILATGHSARDIYELIHNKGWKINAKAFALGVRVEHSQDLIDKIQYHGRTNDKFLPPASYRLVTQVNGRGVYSFCMCPGGIVAPCATNQEEVVTNGWSPSKRNNPYSNAGIVVSVSPDDFETSESDPFVCLNFQKEVERACWKAAGCSQRVPAQRLVDFMNGRRSKSLPESSYLPGLQSVDLNEVLPGFICDCLREAFKTFDKKMKGFVNNEAVLHAPESRTSSTVHIPRKEDMQHPDIKGLYPCGEGAGYAGGIISAAIDGMKCMEQIFDEIKSD
jgi:uncharacterized FAD-dependent dehydrogenase